MSDIFATIETLVSNLCNICRICPYPLASGNRYCYSVKEYTSSILSTFMVDCACDIKLRSSIRLQYICHEVAILHYMMLHGIHIRIIIVNCVSVLDLQYKNYPSIYLPPFIICYKNQIKITPFVRWLRTLWRVGTAKYNHKRNSLISTVSRKDIL